MSNYYWILKRKDEKSGRFSKSRHVCIGLKSFSIAVVVPRQAKDAYIDFETCPS